MVMVAVAEGEVHPAVTQDQHLLCLLPAVMEVPQEEEAEGVVEDMIMLIMVVE